MLRHVFYELLRRYTVWCAQECGDDEERFAKSQEIDTLLAYVTRPYPIKRMMFGKYRGALLEDVPISYIRWMLGTEIDADLRWNLERRAESERGMTITDPLVRGFVNDLIRKNRSPRTQEAYARDMALFATWLASDLKDGTKKQIRDFTYYLLTERKYRVVTTRRVLSTIRTFYNYLRREEIIDANPALDVDLPKPEQRKPKVLRVGEVVSMLGNRRIAQMVASHYTPSAIAPSSSCSTAPACAVPSSPGSRSMT